MSGVAVMIGSTVAGIGGALIQGSAAQNAANTQAQAATSATQQQSLMFQQEQANAAPWLASGRENLGNLNAAMPDLTRQFTMDDFHNSPGYQFQLAQGEQAMQRSASASGMLNSTGTQQNLNNYAQGMANTDYQQALANFTNNQQQRYNMLSNNAGMGLTATGMSNATSMNYANNMGQNAMAAGNANSAGQIGVGNAIAGGLTNAGNNYMGYSMMNNLMGQNKGMQMGNTQQNFNNGAWMTGASGFGGGGAGNMIPGGYAGADPGLYSSLV